MAWPADALPGSSNIDVGPCSYWLPGFLSPKKDRSCSNVSCPEKSVLARPDLELKKLILKGCGYGLDVIAMIGERNIHGHRSFAEIHKELVKEHGVLISERHVSNLFRLYLGLVGLVTSTQRQ